MMRESPFEKWTERRRNDHKWGPRSGQKSQEKQWQLQQGSMRRQEKVGHVEWRLGTPTPQRGAGFQWKARTLKFFRCICPKPKNIWEYEMENSRVFCLFNLVSTPSLHALLQTLSPVIMLRDFGIQRTLLTMCWRGRGFCKLNPRRYQTEFYSRLQGHITPLKIKRL